jgi:CHASE3 domain sensor protein
MKLDMLKHVRIAKKIGGGFGLVLALLLVIGVAGVVSLNNTGSLFTQYRELARQTNEVGRIQANMLMTRMGVKDFIINGNENAIKTVRDREAATMKIVDDALALITEPKLHDTVETIDKDLEEYIAAFDHVIELQGSRNQLVALLDEAGPQM